MKKVSVIIPAYNHDSYIGDAIQSVLASTYKNIEVIVMDDGSKDSTKEKVLKFDKVDYYYQENAGAHNAINAGIAKATGDYIAILNDDDMYSIDHIQLAIQNLNDFGNDIFIGKARLIGHGSKLKALKEHLLQSSINIEQFGYAKSLFQLNWSLSTSAFVFKRDLFNKLNGFQNFTMCHDLDFLIRALVIDRSGVGTSLIPSWSYRCHETNTGSSIPLLKQHAEVVYSLGRAMNLLGIETSLANLEDVIGHGVSHKIFTLASKSSPWMQESRHTISDSINTWIDLCEIELAH